MAESSCPGGEAAFRAGEFEQARELLRRCLDEGGESVDVLLPLAVMAIQTGRPEEAVGYSGRAVSLDEANPEARYWHGRALLDAGRIEEARSEWEAGLRLSSNHAGILEGLAKLAMAEGKNAQAYNLLTQLQRSGVDEAWVHRMLADIAASKGLWTQALGHINDVVAREEPDLELLLLAAQVGLMASDTDAALDYGRRAVRLQPGAASFGGLGEVFFAREEVDSALVYLRQAIELDPAASRIRFNLANALEVQGMTDEAEVHFQAFLKAEPNDPVGRFNYGIHLQKQGRLDEALQEISLAIANDPGMLSARVVRGQMLEVMGRFDEALQDVAYLRQADSANESELVAWERDLRLKAGNGATVHPEGQIHLLHLVVPDPEVAQRISGELKEGSEFGSLAVQFSVGPAAQRGGDIGWIDPRDMVEPMRSAIAKLEENEISPPVESGGLYHIFKRIP